MASVDDQLWSRTRPEMVVQIALSADRISCRGPTQGCSLVLRQSISQKTLIEATHCQQVSFTQHGESNGKDCQHAPQSWLGRSRQGNAGRRPRTVIIRKQQVEQLLVSTRPASFFLPTQSVSFRKTQTSRNPKEARVIQSRPQVLQEMQGRCELRGQKLTR